MAGLWNRIERDRSATGESRIATHLVNTVFAFYARGKATRAQLKTKIDEWLARKNNAEIPQAVLDDLTSIADKIDTFATEEEKTDYTDFMKDVNMAAELGMITESQWRTQLGI